MSLENRTGIEAVLAITSIAIGVTGAALVEPIVLGVAAAVAVLTTALRLYDRSDHTQRTAKREKARIA